MAIDWVTVSAQIVNFLLLVWLLKRFLYQPVLSAMDRREQDIAERLGAALDREQQAEAKIQQYEEKSTALEQSCSEILNAAEAEAGEQKKAMFVAARQQVAASREQWQRQVDEEKQAFLEELRSSAAETIQAIARKALGDLANAGLEEQMVEGFMIQLQTLDKNDRQLLLDAAGPVHILSTFQLDSRLRSRLTRAIQQQLGSKIKVTYGQGQALLCGIELRCGSQRLGWNLADYMQELQVSIHEALRTSQPDNRGEA